MLHVIVTFTTGTHFIVFLFLVRYMVDAADHEKLEASRNELHNLLDKPQLAGIPVSHFIAMREFKHQLFLIHGCQTEVTISELYIVLQDKMNGKQPLSHL